jgi:hypothetical protein
MWHEIFQAAKQGNKWFLLFIHTGRGKKNTNNSKSIKMWLMMFSFIEYLHYLLEKVVPDEG